MEDKINKIIQMDCLEYLRSLPDECTECVLIDEPYMLLKGHKIEEGYNLDIAKQVRIEAMRVLKKDGWFIFFGQFPTAWDFGRITMEVGFKPYQMCNEFIWCKRIRSNHPHNTIGRVHENIFVFQKGKPQTYENKAPYEDIVVLDSFFGLMSYEGLKSYIQNLKKQVLKKSGELKDKMTNNLLKRGDAEYNRWGIRLHSRDLDTKVLPSVWSFVSENRRNLDKDNIQHISSKPVLLFRRLIKLFTQEGDTVLDCFMGSGTTALASIQEGRNFLCCERDEGYVKIANDRLANWQEDLLRQDKWLNDRGVMDFESDIKEQAKQEQTQETLI